MAQIDIFFPIFFINEMAKENERIIMMEKDIRKREEKLAKKEMVADRILKDKNIDIEKVTFRTSAIV